MLVIRAGTHKMYARKPIREDPDQQSDLGLPCLSRLFCLADNYYLKFLNIYQQENYKPIALNATKSTEYLAH